MEKVGTKATGSTSAISLDHALLQTANSHMLHIRTCISVRLLFMPRLRALTDSLDRRATSQQEFVQQADSLSVDDLAEGTSTVRTE